MVQVLVKPVKKSLDTPDEVRTLSLGRIEVVDLDDVSIARVTLEPGWKWSKDVKPVVQTESCQVPHIQYVLSGRLRIRMDGGAEFELKPGDAVVVPPGHDAEVVGDEPFVAIDFTGMKGYGKKP